MNTRIALLFYLLVTASACTSAQINTELKVCTEPRPEICTMDYTPVCGLQTVSGKEQWKTYSNACSACSDSSVSGYVENACPAGDQ